MRDFLLRMYAILKRLPSEHPLHAAVAVALAMLEPDDRLAAHMSLIPGDIPPASVPCSLLDADPDPALALGAAAALNAGCEGALTVAPVTAAYAAGPEFPQVLQLAVSLHLPVVFLLECGEEFSDDLEAQAALGEIERIEADAQDAMRLMPALRLAIDKAREGDGPTLIECVSGPDAGEPAAHLADVLITEGYATPEELL